MANIVTDLTCELTSLVKVKCLRGNLFSQDNAANTINVSVLRNGEPESLSGTITANVIRADGSTVAVSGAFDGNVAYIVLPQACYAIPGIISIVIKNTQGSTVTTIAAVITNVYQSSTDVVVDPGTIIPSIETLISQIEDAVDSIPVDYSDLLNTIADDYTSKPYAVGEYAWQAGALKRCIVPITVAETYTAAHWTNAILGKDLSALKSAIDPMFYYVDIMANKATAGNNNTAMTNNNDGSVTIGTTDNGNTTFGALLSLAPGDYYLYGVPNGIAFLTTSNQASSAYNNRIFENATSEPKRYHTDSTVSVYVGFRSPSRPSAEYTIYPALYLKEQVDRSLHIEKPVSFNGNYFTDTESVWNNGYYKTATGTIDSSDTLQYAYCPLVGSGNYIAVIRYGDFGSNTAIIGFADDKYRFVKSITGTRDGNNVSFSVSADDLIRCKYVVIRRDKTKDFSPKLFYNAPASGGIYNEPPKYGYSTSNLYKKIVVCDGDSICAGYLDNPKRFGAWFGRLQNNYQMTGENYAVSGGTITDLTSQTPTRHSLVLTIDTIYSEHPQLDYLILEGGTNDADLIGNFDGDTPPEGFGTWSDENVSDYNGNYDNTTFCGAVEELFYKAVTYYPNAKIGFIIPMQMGTLMIPSKRRRRYFDEIIKIAKKWHINVLDLWNVCHADARISAYYGGTEGDLTKFYYDGQHPTSVGYDLLQPMIEAWMKTL